jgi:hypothetical protein
LVGSVALIEIGVAPNGPPASAEIDVVADVALHEGTHAKVNLPGSGSDHTFEHTGPRQGLNDLAGVDLEIRVASLMTSTAIEPLVGVTERRVRRS